MNVPNNNKKKKEAQLPCKILASCVNSPAKESWRGLKVSKTAMLLTWFECSNTKWGSSYFTLNYVLAL